MPRPRIGTRHFLSLRRIHKNRAHIFIVQIIIADSNRNHMMDVICSSMCGGNVGQTIRSRTLSHTHSRYIFSRSRESNQVLPYNHIGTIPATMSETTRQRCEPYDKTVATSTPYEIQIKQQTKSKKHVSVWVQLHESPPLLTCAIVLSAHVSNS